MALSEKAKQKAFADGQKDFAAGRYNPPIRTPELVLSFGLAYSADDIERDRIYPEGRDNAKQQS
jgi:hypothetical protein